MQGTNIRWDTDRELLLQLPDPLYRHAVDRLQTVAYGELWSSMRGYGNSTRGVCRSISWSQDRVNRRWERILWSNDWSYRKMMSPKSDPLILQGLASIVIGRVVTILWPYEDRSLDRIRSKWRIFWSSYRGSGRVPEARDRIQSMDHMSPVRSSDHSDGVLPDGDDDLWK